MTTKKTNPAATVIIMVRHGKTPTTGKMLPSRTDSPHLNEVGQNEALEVAKRLSKIGKVTAIYSSPLGRARQTAAPIGAILNKEIVIHKGLIDCDFGTWAGIQLDLLIKRPEWSTVQRAPSTFRFPNGESFAEMQTRIVSTLEELRRRHHGGVIICVSHADPIKAAVAHAMGTHLDLFQRIAISTCSVSAVAYSPDGPRVLTVNSTGDELVDLQVS